MTIEDHLRAAVDKGLTNLTLYAEWSTDHKTVYWTCRGTPSARHGYVGVEHDIDPVNALVECLKALPGAKLRESKGRQRAKIEPDPENVTTPVTEEPTQDHPTFEEWLKP